MCPAGCRRPLSRPEGSSAPPHFPDPRPRSARIESGRGTQRVSTSAGPPRRRWEGSSRGASELEVGALASSPGGAASAPGAPARPVQRAGRLGSRGGGIRTVGRSRAWARVGLRRAPSGGSAVRSRFSLRLCRRGCRSGRCGRLGGSRGRRRRGRRRGWVCRRRCTRRSCRARWLSGGRAGASAWGGIAGRRCGRGRGIRRG